MILFIPHNAYHTYNLWLIAQELQALGLPFAFLNIDAVHHEGVTQKAAELGIDTLDYAPGFLRRLRPSAVVTMNDWGAVTRAAVLRANLKGIPTFSVVEGVQDFEDTHVETHPGFRRRYPYTRSRFPLLTGDYDRKFIKNPRAAVVGIARIEKLLDRDCRFPSTDRAVINSNFSYGKYARFAEKWISDVVTACTDVGIDYVISQHIADETDLNAYHTSTTHINDLVCQGTLLISRFSTCMLEAMVLGKPVLYYNNFNEKVDKFLHPDGAFELATDLEDLKVKLRKTLAFKEKYVEEQQAFLKRHVSIDPERSAARRAAEFIAAHLSPVEVSFVEKLKMIRDEVRRRLQLE